MARKRKKPSALDRAQARFRMLLGEIERLTVAFPELHDAMDDDDLPIRFLLRRGADRARRRAKRVAATTSRRPTSRKAAASRKAGERKK